MAQPPMFLPGANDTEKLEALSNLTHKQQAVWFLNAFWDSVEGTAETIWKYVHKFQDFDLQNRENGTGLDELNAHRFLEFFQNTHTVAELRTKLRETGAIGQKPPKMFPLIHFLVYEFSSDFHTLVNASQGDNSKEIAEAQHKLDLVSEAFAEADRTAKAATAAFRASDAAEKEAVSREQIAISREEDCRKQEAPFKAAAEELQAAVADLKAQEDAYAEKLADLEAKSSQGTIVQQNKAKNELAQLKAENPLPLRRAKITQEAASKKADKARAPFEAALREAEAAREQASSARATATKAKKAAEQAKRAADAAVEEAKARMAEAEAFLEELKNKPGCAHGAMWWMERQLHEKKKFMPTSKGGIAKS